MPYPSRNPARKRSLFSPELLYLLVVLAAGVATAWWAGQKVGADLSAITTAAAVLGLNERVGTTRAVGHAAPAADQQALTAAPFCEAGQAPTFSHGLAALRRDVGDAMGSPVECEHVSSVSGDTIQQTTTGLAAYYTLTNTVTFTDGWHHWAITSSGYVRWDGTDPLPSAVSVPGAE